MNDLKNLIEPLYVLKNCSNCGCLFRVSEDLKDVVNTCDICHFQDESYQEEDFEDNFSQSEADNRERDEYFTRFE